LTVEQSGYIDLKGEARDYTKFFLQHNPFPSLPIPQESPPITADRVAPIKKFKDSVAELTNTGVTVITVVVGEYGSGKSHLLRIFKRNVNSQLLSLDKGMLAIYVKTPGNDFTDLLFGFIDDVGKSLLTEYARVMLLRYMKANTDEVLAKIFEPSVQKRFLSGDFDIDEVLANSSFVDINSQVRSALFPDVKSDDLVMAFLTLPHPEYGPKAWKWLIGGELDRGEREVLRIGEGIRDPDTAFRLFGEFVKVLNVVGVKSFVILVDELEKITFLTKTSRTNYQDVLRQWIDAYPSNACFYFAIAPHQWDLLVKEPTALVRRLSGNWYVLQAFGEAETRELIEKYLGANRVEPYEIKEAKKNFPSCESELAPFTKESIPVVQSVSKGTVSTILLLCRRSLEHLYDNFEKYRAVTPELVKLVAKEEGFE
jgi:hypothetical protein